MRICARKEEPSKKKSSGVEAPEPESHLSVTFSGQHCPNCYKKKQCRPGNETRTTYERLPVRCVDSTRLDDRMSRKESGRMSDILQGITRISDLCEWANLSEEEVLSRLESDGVQIRELIGIRTVDEKSLRELNRRGEVSRFRKRETENAETRNQNANSETPQNTGDYSKRENAELKTRDLNSAFSKTRNVLEQTAKPRNEWLGVDEEAFDEEVNDSLDTRPLEKIDHELMRMEAVPPKEAGEYLDLARRDGSPHLDPGKRVIELVEHYELYGTKLRGRWAVSTTSLVLYAKGNADPRCHAMREMHENST